jgi:hypothetical protein
VLVAAWLLWRRPGAFANDIYRFQIPLLRFGKTAAGYSDAAGRGLTNRCHRDRVGAGPRQLTGVEVEELQRGAFGADDLDPAGGEDPAVSSVERRQDDVGDESEHVITVSRVVLGGLGGDRDD